MTVKHTEWSGKLQDIRDGEVLVDAYFRPLLPRSMVCITPFTLSRLFPYFEYHISVED